MKLKSIFATVILTFIVGMAAALPPGGVGNPSEEEDPDVPVDGGISILLVAGAAYGAKKVLKKK